jgi:hypothetical protein
VEELTKSVLESGATTLGIPTSLHDSLMARLDRLASVRRVAQIGAAIGREFPYLLVRAVSRLPEDELQASLARLVGSELVFQRGTPPDAIYAFKHALPVALLTLRPPDRSYRWQETSKLWKAACEGFSKLVRSWFTQTLR